MKNTMQIYALIGELQEKAMKKVLPTAYFYNYNNIL